MKDFKVIKQNCFSGHTAAALESNKMSSELGSQAKLTVSVVDMEETLWNLVLEADDCLLSTGSLKEESLCDADIQSLLGACDRKCRQGTFSARVSLLKKTVICLQNAWYSNVGYRVVRWTHSPVFWVDDCIDERVINGWRLGYDSRNSFGIGIEDASVSERYKECSCTSSVIIRVLEFDLSFLLTLWQELMTRGLNLFILALLFCR